MHEADVSSRRRRSCLHELQVGYEGHPVKALEGRQARQQLVAPVVTGILECEQLRCMLPGRLALLVRIMCRCKITTRGAWPRHGTAGNGLLVGAEGQARTAQKVYCPLAP